MVQIQVDLGPSPLSTEQGEDILIELQGSFEVQGAEFISQQLRTNSHIRDILIGELNLKKDPITLRIGNHLLEGTKITLKKPLLLMKKSSSIPKSSPENDSMDLERYDINSDDVPPPKYVIEKIYKTKYLFKTRPEYRPLQP